MSRPAEIIGEVVEEIRAQRRHGAHVSQIVRYLLGLGLHTAEISQYLEQGFCLEDPPNLFLSPKDEKGNFIDEALDSAFGAAIDQAQEKWTTAGPYPDLMRRCDRHAFRMVAQLRQIILIVQAGNPFSGRMIGQAGFRCAPADLQAIPRLTPPNAGLMSADPNDQRLVELLQSARPSMNYQQYADRLRQLGFIIGEEPEGFIIRDENGCCFYPSYLLLGAYTPESGRNAWIAPDGEHIRADLNRRMGQELIQSGPVEAWNPALPGVPREGAGLPPLPAIGFLPDGNVENLLDLDAARSFYKYLDIDWDSLYPSDTALEANGRAE